MGVAHRVLDQPDPDRSREGVGNTERALDQRDVPDVGLAGEEQRRGRDLRGALHEVGADEDRPSRQPIGEDAAEQQEHDHRDLAGQQDDAEIGGRPELEDGEGEGDDGHAAAELGHDVRAQVADEVALAEHLERSRQSHGGESRVEPAGRSGLHRPAVRLGPGDRHARIPAWMRVSLTVTRSGRDAPARGNSIGPRCYAPSTFPTSGMHVRRRAPGRSLDGQPSTVIPRKEARMLPLLLWILGVPGLIIILLLLLGVINI